MRQLAIHRPFRVIHEALLLQILPKVVVSSRLDASTSVACISKPAHLKSAEFGSAEPSVENKGTCSTCSSDILQV